LRVVQTEDLYALILERHRRATFILTSSREVSEWVALFANSILANSALDRLASGTRQLVIEGPRYRTRPALKVCQQGHM
jgi:DNA replication protein DnaC